MGRQCALVDSTVRPCQPQATSRSPFCAAFHRRARKSSASPRLNGGTGPPEGRGALAFAALILLCGSYAFRNNCRSNPRSYLCTISTHSTPVRAHRPGPRDVTRTRPRVGHHPLRVPSGPYDNFCLKTDSVLGMQSESSRASSQLQIPIKRLFEDSIRVL